VLQHEVMLRRPGTSARKRGTQSNLALVRSQMWRRDPGSRCARPGWHDVV